MITTDNNGSFVCSTPAEVSFVKSVFALNDALREEQRRKMVQLGNMYGVTCVVISRWITTFQEDVVNGVKNSNPEVVLRND